MRIIGLDPGLQYTGWGVIDKKGSSISYVNGGVIAPNKTATMGSRLATLHNEILKVLQDYQPKAAVIEKTFVNSNGVTTLKLGQARGVVIMTPALQDIEIIEYSPNTIKKVVTGAGHASKEQVQKMVQMVLPSSNVIKKQVDMADALAIALCHAYTIRS